MKIFRALWLFLLLSAQAVGQSSPYDLLPRPQFLEQHPGFFQLKKIIFTGEKLPFSPFREWLLEGKTAQVQDRSGENKGSASRGAILRRINPALPEEAYELRISPKKIEVTAGSNTGFFYAEQTLIQLAEQNGGKQLPCLLLRDQPRFAWRGMHLDESRHFMGKAFVIKYIDWLAALKMNVFHWHLTDAQGWRIEIKKYPKLTSVAAWRPDRTGILNSDADTARLGEPMTYGGFYTQDDIRDIVQYAAERHVTIIPEIEMPGHTTAALVAYPELSCSGGPFPMPGGAKNCPYPNFCLGNPDTYTFLEGVLSEVIALFPSQYIHIGGDEVERDQWRKCGRCQHLKDSLHLDNEAQLQVWFTQLIEDFLLKNGRSLLGWDEIMEGGSLTPSAGVMVWRGEGPAREATAAGHEVVITHNYYFDLYQGSPEFEPVSYGYLPLERVYRYDPVPADFSEAQRRKVLGVQGCLWTENVYDTRKAEYMVFPRLLALAEVAWTPAERLDWPDFQRRLPGLLRWLDQRDTRYATSVFDPAILIAPDSASGRLVCRISQQIPFGNIFYSVDGSQPTNRSTSYSAPFLLEKTCDIRATAFWGNDRQSKSLRVPFRPSLASGKSMQLSALPDKRYNGEHPEALTDGLDGSAAFHDGHWCGFHGEDFDLTLDLGAVQPLQTLSLHWLEAEGSWIFLPLEMWVEISPGGRNWTRKAFFSKNLIATASAGRIKPVSVDLEGTPARFVRIFGKNPGQHPVYPDGKCWLFVDEVRVD